MHIFYDFGGFKPTFLNYGEISARGSCGPAHDKFCKKNCLRGFVPYDQISHQKVEIFASYGFTRGYG